MLLRTDVNKVNELVLCLVLFLKKESAVKIDNKDYQERRT